MCGPHRSHFDIRMPMLQPHRPAILMFSVLFAVGCSENGQRSQTTGINIQSPMPDSTVERFIGMWRWHYADSATYHMELMRDGKAKIYRGRNVISSSGRWNSPDGKTLILKLENPPSSQQVCHKGTRPHESMVVALLQKSTRQFEPDMNDEEEFMEIAALPSDADFPWGKVDAISESLRERRTEN